MFDQVGRGERLATRNRAGALGLTVAAVASAAGLAFWLLTQGVREILAAPEPTEEIVFLDPTPEAPLELPAAPAAPPPALRGTADPDAEPVVTPQTPPDDPAPLSPVVPDKVVGQAGDPDGHDQGAVNGKPGGKPLGTGTGDGDGPGGGGGVKRIEFGDLEVKRRFEPVYPPAAKSMGLGDVRCDAVVRISPEGVPTEVNVRGCPEVFHAETREALLRWRFYPVRAGKTPVSTMTSFSVTYRLH